MSFPHWRLILNGKSAGNPAVREAVHALRGRGITLDRLAADGRGEADPLTSNATEEGRVRNRRIELILSPMP